MSQEQLCHTVVVLKHVMNLMCHNVTAFPEQPALGRRGVRGVAFRVEGALVREEAMPPHPQDDKKSKCFCSLRSLPFVPPKASLALYLHCTLKMVSFVFLCLCSFFFLYVC